MTFKAVAFSHRQAWRLRCTHGAVALCALLFAALPLHVQAQNDRLGNRPNSPIHAFGETFTAPEAVIAQQLRMVFYRTEQSSSVPGAASIYVNGAYHASLVAGGYSQLCLPSGGAEVAVKSVQIGRPVKATLDTITVLPTAGGQTQYLRVQEVAQGRQLLQPVASALALQEIQGLREQTHTISRVPAASACITHATAAAPAVAAPVAAAPALQTITLAADALFAFARSDLNALSPTGKASLDALVSRLGRDYIQLERLNIIGHADPLGQPGPNERLAFERANTVRNYLSQAGLRSDRISSEGRGDREPVVTHCGFVATPQAITCHAPNRRVVIDVTGARR
ncbi:MAG: outer membrane protein precursor [Pseudomonadota bacterium]